MSLRSYLLGLKISALFAFFAWALVVLYVDPEESGVLGRSLFFITLFLWLSGVFTLFFTWLRIKISGEERVANALGMSVRQGIFIASFAIILLGLRYWKFLALWNTLLIAAAILLVELHFMHRFGSINRPQEAESKTQQSRSRLKDRTLL